MSVWKCKSGIQILDPVLSLVYYLDLNKKNQTILLLNQINFHDQNTGHIWPRIWMPDVVKTVLASARYSGPLCEIWTTTMTAGDFLTWEAGLNVLQILWTKDIGGGSAWNPQL